MGVSTPKVVVKINDEEVRWREVSVNAPAGSGSATATVRLGKLTPVNPGNHLTIEMGYEGRAGTDPVFDTTFLDSQQYTIRAEGDEVTVAFRSRLDLYAKRAPMEDELWYANRGGIHALIRYVATKCGYSGVKTNIPNIPLPSVVTFTPKEGYWGLLIRFLTPLRPLILPDDMRGVLYVWSLDVGIPGQATRLSLRRAEDAAIPKQVRDTVNLAILKYYPAGQDGGLIDLDLDCASPDARFSDALGEIVGLTSAACGVSIDPGVDQEFVERVSYEPVEVGDGEPSDEVAESPIRIERRDRYVVPISPDGLAQDPIPTSSVTTTWATIDGLPRRTQRTEKTFLYVRGTNYRYSAGHRLSTSEYGEMPLAGADWIPNIYSESESIVYLVTAERELIRYRSVKRTRGRILRTLAGLRMSLQEAIRNRVVDTSPATAQYTVTGQILTETTELSPGGSTSLRYMRTRHNHLTGYHEGPVDAGEAVGRQPTKDESRPEPVEESYPDPQYLNDDGTYTEPPEGWITATEIDGTWISTDLEAPSPGEERLVGREWCKAMADAMFRRSGKRIATYQFNGQKLVTRVHRGAKVLAGKRGDEDPREFVVIGTEFRAERVTGGSGAGGIVVHSSVTAQRLERAPDAPF
jgi:hypothetical protein